MTRILTLLAALFIVAIGLFIAAISVVAPALAATVRVEYVRTSSNTDGAQLGSIDQLVDATGLLIVTTGSPLTGASRLTVPTPATSSSLQLYARITAVDGAVIVRTGSDAAGTGPGLYVSVGDTAHIPVTPGDRISMIETTPVTQAAGGGSGGGLTDAQLRASPLTIVGARPNDGSGTAAGNFHSTVGGSDGTNLRPLLVDPSGRLQIVVPDTSTSGTITTQNLNGTVGAATAGSSVGFASLNGFATVAIQVTGTYTGVLTPQVTIDGTNWVALGGTPIVNVGTGAYSTTIASAAVGIFTVDVTGYSGFRLVATAAVTGTANVSLRAAQSAQMVALSNPIPAGGNNIGAVVIGTGSAMIGSTINSSLFTDTATPLAASATFTGTARDLGTSIVVPWSYFNATFFADQSGTAFIEFSTDNITWTAAATGNVSANVALSLRAVIVARYWRVRFVNGTSTQTVFRVSSAWTAN